jgi:N-dimethylarginine dimethylaminohydrolase
LDWVASQCSLALHALELKDPRFYHLDTCLSILGPQTALACREAFTAEGWATLENLFPQLLICPQAEANSPGFACNCHCPDGKTVVIQKGNLRTNALLREAGFGVTEVDTSEFIKAGGSVFCMKMMFW